MKSFMNDPPLKNTKKIDEKVFFCKIALTRSRTRVLSVIPPMPRFSYAFFRIIGLFSKKLNFKEIIITFYLPDYRTSFRGNPSR